MTPVAARRRPSLSSPIHATSPDTFHLERALESLPRHLPPVTETASEENKGQDNSDHTTLKGEDEENQKNIENEDSSKEPNEKENPRISPPSKPPKKKRPPPPRRPNICGTMLSHPFYTYKLETLCEACFLDRNSRIQRFNDHIAEAGAGLRWEGEGTGMGKGGVKMMQFQRAGTPRAVVIRGPSTRGRKRKPPTPTWSTSSTLVNGEEGGARRERDERGRRVLEEEDPFTTTTVATGRDKGQQQLKRERSLRNRSSRVLDSVLEHGVGGAVKIGLEGLGGSSWKWKGVGGVDAGGGRGTSGVRRGSGSAPGGAEWV
ncbi:MAG: hypothetical protein Q9227_004224 [Pyrenula ochraceoflavens]